MTDQDYDSENWERGIRCSCGEYLGKGEEWQKLQHLANEHGIHFREVVKNKETGEVERV